MLQDNDTGLCKKDSSNTEYSIIIKYKKHNVKQVKSWQM